MFTPTNLPIVYRLAAVAGMIAVVGCAAHRVRVVSSPDGAEVFKVSGDGPGVALGKTPLDLDEGAIFGPGEAAAQLRIVKDGFNEEHVLLPTTALPAQRTITADLEARIESKVMEHAAAASCPEPGLTAARTAVLARGIAETQRFISRREYQAAETRISVLLSEFPNVAVLYDLQGNTFYLQKRLPEALAAYERSLSLDGSNPDTARMATTIRQRTDGLSH